MAPDHLFVYGTLRRGSKNKFARLLAERGQFLSPARVSGELYDLGEYPGARRISAPDRWIQGEIWRFTHPELLPLLDDYEGSEFERAQTTAHRKGGSMHCWIYWYIGADRGRLIESGDWLRR